MTSPAPLPRMRSKSYFRSYLFIAATTRKSIADVVSSRSRGDSYYRLKDALPVSNQKVSLFLDHVGFEFPERKASASVLDTKYDTPSPRRWYILTLEVLKDHREKSDTIYKKYILCCRPVALNIGI